MAIDPPTFPMFEQASGSFIATLRDDFGAMIPGSILTALRLSLYTVRKNGQINYVNNRNRQNVLNQGDVTVYDSLQTLADGRTYNLRWAVQPADTTLVEAVPFERHLFLFEFTWAQGEGKQNGALVVENLAVI